MFCKTHAQQWTVLGNENQVSSVASSYTTITVLGDVPYVAYVENSSPTVAKVKRKNSVTGTWEQVGADVATNISYLRLYSDGSNNLYVCYVDGANSSRLAVKLYNAVTQTWDALVPGNALVSTGTVTYSISQFNGTPRAAMAFDNNQVPYIFYSERTSGNAYAKRFINGAWETLGSGTVSTDIAAGNGIAIDNNDVPFVVYLQQSSLTATTGVLKAYRYDSASNTWQNISPPNPVLPGSATTGATSSIRHTAITMDSSFNPIVSYFNTSNSNRSTIIRYDKTANAWNYIGATGTRDAPYNSIVRDNGGNVYNSFTDLLINGGTVPMARLYKLGYGTSSFVEVKNTDVTRGIDDASASNLNAAIGSDTSKPFVVYTKTNSVGVVTPVVQMFSQKIITKAVTNIGTTTATAGGEITSSGSNPVTERGIVYGTTPNPTTANNKIADGAIGLGAYTIPLSGLSDYTLYYVRAYYINADGTSYGASVSFSTLSLPDAIVTTPKQMEYLNRGLVAVRTSASIVYVGWRLLGTEPSGISFNVYRDGVKINASPIVTSTNYTDAASADGVYTVKPIISGVEGNASEAVAVWAQNQLSIPLQIPAGGTTLSGEAYTYSANDCSVGDVDGDGEYEYFVKWDPSNSKDNSQSGYTGNVYMDCYKLNGTRLWRIDLGKNIRTGAHYTQFIVYDLDGDGKAEMACKTADGTVDGTNVTIGDPLADYRNASGYILTGPEFLTVFNGLTGAAMATTNYLPGRGTVGNWGDTYGNRVDRFIAVVAYLDGARPSLVMGRGYYTRLVRVAWDWRNGQLTHRWTFDSNDPNNGNYAGQGNHQMTVGDVDGDGKDEIFNGSSAINDNGRRFWASGFGHGDALHMTDMDPDIPGQEIWQCLEDQGSYSPYGLRFNDAKTGTTIWGVSTSGDIGRAMAADIDPLHRGYEVWGSSGNLYNCKGVQISTNKPTINFGIWWDGDLSRELLDGNVLDKWNPSTNSLGRLFTIYNAAPVSSNNSTKKNIGLTADLFGDWREEMVFRRTDNTALVIFTTTIPTTERIFTLMHDPQYRTAVAWQNAAYNQPPYPSFYLGNEMTTPPPPNIYLAGQSSLPVKLSSVRAYQKATGIQVEWIVQTEIDIKNYEVEKSTDGRSFIKKGTKQATGNSMSTTVYDWLDVSPNDGNNYYRIKANGKNGDVQYSKVVKVNLASSAGEMIIYPTPFSGNSFTLQLNTIPKGLYQLRLTNSLGQQVFSKQFNHSGGSAVQIIDLPQNIATGMYHVELKGDELRLTKTLLKN